MANTRKIIKKRWHPVYALKPLENKFIGEVYVATPEEMINRFILINLSVVTNNYAHQHFNAKFRIEEVDGDKGLASIYGYFMQQAYEKRVVRRNKEKIVDSFAVKTKDDKLVVVKPLIIAMSRIAKSIQRKIRLYTRHYFATQAASKNYEEFMDNIINGKYQAELKKALSKFYPISTAELRKVYRAEKFALIINRNQYKEEFEKN